MKKLISLFFIIILGSSCMFNAQNTNKVALLKIDYLTYSFEGGKELSFIDHPSFTITTTYQSPGDFGSVQLYYSELGKKIFDGSIIWSGCGVISFPNIDTSTSFILCDNPLQMPDTSQFKKVMYDDYSHYPDSLPYLSIWNSISNLEVVKDYKTSNPDGNINLFLYTPSVGAGNPADWDWYVIIKN